MRGAPKPLPLPLLLALAACAAPPPAGPAAPAAATEERTAAAPGEEPGRVLGLRPLAPPRGAVAPAFLALAAGGEPGGPLAYEVLVRLERTGRDVALLHPAEPGLGPGERVAVSFEPRPRLRRLPGG